MTLLLRSLNNLSKPMKTYLKPYIHEKRLVFSHGLKGVHRSRNLHPLRPNVTFAKSLDSCFLFSVALCQHRSAFRQAIWMALGSCGRILRYTWSLVEAPESTVGLLGDSGCESSGRPW